jgi:hypothetical protein
MTGRPSSAQARARTVTRVSDAQRGLPLRCWSWDVEDSACVVEDDPNQ